MTYPGVLPIWPCHSGWHRRIAVTALRDGAMMENTYRCYRERGVNILAIWTNLNASATRDVIEESDWT